MTLEFLENSLFSILDEIESLQDHSTSLSRSGKAKNVFFLNQIQFASILFHNCINCQLWNTSKIIALYEASNLT